MTEQYLEVSKKILTNKDSVFKFGSKGSGLISLYGNMAKYDLRKGFPLLTTKRVPKNMIIHELLWFLRGDTNIKYLEDNGIRIWRRDVFQHKHLACLTNRNKNLFLLILSSLQQHIR